MRGNERTDEIIEIKYSSQLYYISQFVGKDFHWKSEEKKMFEAARKTTKFNTEGRWAQQDEQAEEK